MAEAHPKVRAYVKNHNLGLEVPYRSGSDSRIYIPDFIVDVDDGRGEDDPLHLVVEIKGYRNEDAKAKKLTMETYWVPGVNNLGQYGRWAFAEFTDVYDIESGFYGLVQGFVEDSAFRTTALSVPRNCSRPAPLMRNSWFGLASSREKSIFDVSARYQRDLGTT